MKAVSHILICQLLSCPSYSSPPPLPRADAMCRAIPGFGIHAPSSTPNPASRLAAAPLSSPLEQQHPDQKILQLGGGALP